MWSSSATAKQQHTDQVTADHKRCRGDKAYQDMRANTSNPTKKKREERDQKFGGTARSRSVSFQDEVDDVDDSAAGSTARAVSPGLRSALHQVTADPSTAAASALMPTDGSYVELRRKQAAMLEQHDAEARVLKMVAFSLNYMSFINVLFICSFR